MTVRDAAFLGVGAMVGAGIFARLGEAGTVRNDPETFAAIVCAAGLAVVLDLVWKRIRGPRQKPAMVSDSQP